MQHVIHRVHPLNALLVLVFLALAAGTAVADEREMWVQRWGILDGERLCDYDADSGQLLIDYGDGAVLWDVKAGLALRRYPPLAGSSGRTYEGCILDEHILLNGTDFIALLDKQSGRLIRSFDLEGDRPASIAVSDGATLLAAATVHGKLHIWDIETGVRRHAIDAQRSPGEIEFSPDSRLLLCGDIDHVATLWNVETGELRDSVNAIPGVGQVAFSDDGRRMLTAGHGTIWYAPRVIVWDVASLAPQQVIPRSVMDASFAGENVRIVLDTGEVEFWAPDRHEAAPPPDEWPQNPKSRFHVAGVTRNHWLLRSFRDYSQVSLVGPDAGEAVHPATPPFTADEHFPLAISKDGRFLLTGGASHGNRSARAAIWNLQNGRLQLDLVDEYLGAFHPDGKHVVLSRHGKLDVVLIKKGKTVKALDWSDEKYSTGDFTSLRFTADGKRLLAAHGDWYWGRAGALLLWDLGSGKLLRNFVSDDKAVMFAEFTRDEKSILAAFTPGDDGSAGVDQFSVFDADTGELKTTHMFDPNYIHVDPASAAAGLVAGRYARSIRYDKFDGGFNTLWGLQDLSPKVQLPESSPVHGFTPDGQIAVCFEAERVLGFRTTDNGALLHAYETQLHSMRPLLFHPRARMVCGALYDPWTNQGSSMVGVGFEDVLSGQLEAELILFREPGSWLVVSRDRFINGDPDSLSRITWREPATIYVVRDPEHTRTVINPQRIAAAVAQPLADGPPLRDQLRDLPQPMLPEPKVREPEGTIWFRDYRERHRDATKAFQETGADVQIKDSVFTVSLRLEHQPVPEKLLKQFRWTSALKRVELADTGIHDAELDPIGLLPSLTYLSLWGNPITDQGLLQLAGLWNLEVLDVHDTEVTAAGLNALRFLPNLKTLIVSESLRLDALVGLKQQHPDLEIIQKTSHR